MNRFIPNPMPCGRTRREFLWQVGGGFAGLALIDLLTEGGFFTARARAIDGTGAARPPAKAKRCVFLFMNGGPSQVDTFDPKPALTKHHGQPYTGDAKVGSNGRRGRPPHAVAVRVSASMGRAGWRSAACFPHTRRIRR